MSRFICLELDSVSTSEENSVVGEYVAEEIPVVSEVNCIEEEKEMESLVDENPELTVENLSKLGNICLSVNPFKPKDPDPVITTAINLLFAMTKSYHKIKAIEDLRILRSYEYTSYMSEKTSSFFTELYNETEGDYSGSVASIYSWKYGKNDDGSPMYLYISTVDYYGSCSYCDGHIELCDEFFSIQHSIREMIETIDFLNGKINKNVHLWIIANSDKNIIKDENDRLERISDFKKKINENIIKGRELVRDHVKTIIGSLMITRTYNEAVRKITRCDPSYNPPKFLDALKKAFPNKDFSKMEKRAEEKNKLLKGQKLNLVSGYIKGGPVKK